MTRLEITLKHVQVHASTAFTQQVFTCGLRTRLRIAGKIGDQHIEAMSKVCDGLRGDALVAVQEVGFDTLCEIVDGTLRSIDTLINHTRGVVFPLAERELKELTRQYCRPGGPLSRQTGESMKQSVSRRRRCWTLPVKMDPVTQ